MLKTPLFKGCCTAIVTPFTERGIDYGRLEKNLNDQYDNGVSAVVVAGTTGEMATLSGEEYRELLRQSVRCCRSRLTVIAGIGGNNTLTALKNAEYAASIGVDGLLMVTPFYNKTSQTGLIEHFRTVADRVDLPLILYNVPSRTGIGIQAETYEALARHPNINGIKEASGDFSLIAKTRSLCGSNLNLWSGNDDNTVPMMALGAIGVISVASNIVPGVVSKLCDLALSGDYPAAAELYARYSALFSALFIETNPMPVKAAMQMLGTDSGLLRLPLVSISEEHRDALRNTMRSAGLSV